MKRQLLIEIDCEDEHCGKCWYRIPGIGDREYYCPLYEHEDDTKLKDLKIDGDRGPLRCNECKAVEVTGGSIGLAPCDGSSKLVPLDPDEVPPNAEYIDIGLGKNDDLGGPVRWVKIKFERTK